MEKINRKKFRSPLTVEERKFVINHYNKDMTAKEISVALGHPIRIICNYYHAKLRSDAYVLATREREEELRLTQEEEYKKSTLLKAQSLLTKAWKPASELVFEEEE